MEPRALCVLGKRCVSEPHPSTPSGFRIPYDNLTVFLLSPPFFLWVFLTNLPFLPLIYLREHLQTCFRKLRNTFQIFGRFKGNSNPAGLETKLMPNGTSS
jgi:hypothetical protein